MRNSIIALVVFIAYAMVACSKTPPEQAILANVDAIQSALESKNTGDVMAHFKEDFLGNGYLGKPELRRFLVAQFLQHRNVNLLITSMEVDHRPELPLSATIKGVVVVTGAERILPDDGRLFAINGKWRLVEDTWLLENLSWE